MTQALDRPTGTIVPLQSLPAIPVGHIAAMTAEGLKVSAYATGQWIKYGEEQITGRIGGIRWDDAEPVVSELFNHWTGEWYYPGFVYKVHNADNCDDLSTWEEVSEDDITDCLGSAQVEDYEKIRKYKLEQQLLINIVTRCLKENGGKLPEFYFSRLANCISWDEPTYKVGMHVRWEIRPIIEPSKEKVKTGTGLILGVERCIDGEPGFWVYKIHRLTGDQCSDDFDFADHEILEVLYPLDGEAITKVFQWDK